MISISCVMFMWRNDIKCKYMFLFPLKKLAHKGLKGSKPLSEVLMNQFIDVYVLTGLNELI